MVLEVQHPVWNQEFSGNAIQARHNIQIFRFARFVNYYILRSTLDYLFVLVYFGGVMGLFFGCSALSIMELIYYYTLRLYWFIKS